jgi:hypothetical protein
LLPPLLLINCFFLLFHQSAQQNFLIIMTATPIQEIDVARRLIEQQQSAPEVWLQWVHEQPSIEWTPAGAEPDIIKALVLNHLLAADGEFQRRALAALLAHVKEMSSERLKTLLTTRSLLPLLAMCIERYNVCNAGSSKAELIEPTPENRLPQISIETTFTVGGGGKRK